MNAKQKIISLPIKLTEISNKRIFTVTILEKCFKNVFDTKWKRKQFVKPHIQQYDESVNTHTRVSKNYMFTQTHTQNVNRYIRR